MTDLINSIQNIKKCSTFMTIKGYKNKIGEVADYSIVFNISYKTSLERSIKKLQAFNPTSNEEIQAKTALLQSFQNSLKNITNTPSVKVNGNTIHVFGRVVHKKVISSANKSKQISTKERLRNMCDVSKFRQFKINNNLEHIAVDNIKITF